LVNKLTLQPQETAAQTEIVNKLPPFTTVSQDLGAEEEEREFGLSEAG